MANLTLQLLGGFEARGISGLSVDFPTKKAIALLVYLALHQGKRQSREKLATLLWENAGDERARVNLRQTLRLLRKSISAFECACIVSDGDALYLDPVHVEVDAAEFEKLCIAATPDALTRAIELYQGELLEGFGLGEEPFAEWLRTARTKFHSLAVEALRSLQRSHVATGNSEQGIRVAVQLLALDPLHEDVHRSLMQLYADSGDRVRALRQYQTCCDVLRAELGLKPDAETERLHEQIRHGHRAVHEAPDNVEALRLPDKPSIAVLSFFNMSGDPAQEYLADGIAEDIITALSKFRRFYVIARNSTFTYKGKAVSVKEVARELGVRYVLEGSVRKAGSRIRIGTQLVDAVTGRHIWAEHYDRELSDLFDLQDEMTEMIVGAIEPELGAAERARARRMPPDSLDAWERYQRGIWHVWRMTRDDCGQAEKLFQSAIERDPEFGPAYASLAHQYFRRVLLGWTESPEELLRRALQAGWQAISLDDKDAEAHVVLGRVHMIQGEFETAITELEIALDLNANLALAYYALGQTILWSGRARETLAPLHKAIRQSPCDPLLWSIQTLLAVAHQELGEFEEAVEWLKKATRHPNCNFWPHVNLAAAFVGLDRLDAARAPLNDALRIQPDLSLRAIEAMIRVMHPAYKDRALNALRKAGLPE